MHWLANEMKTLLILLACALNLNAANSPSLEFLKINGFHLTWSEKSPNIAYYAVKEWSGKQTMTATSSITEIYMLPVSRLGTNFFNVVAVGKNGVRSNPSTNISAIWKSK